MIVAAKMAMITTTINTSISVKAERETRVFIGSLPHEHAGPGGLLSESRRAAGSQHSSSSASALLVLRSPRLCLRLIRSLLGARQKKNLLRSYLRVAARE